MTFEKTTISLDADNSETADIRLNTNPGQANNPAITYASSDTDVATLAKLNDKEIRVTAVGAGTATITATAGSVTTTLTVTVTGTQNADANTNVQDNTRTTKSSTKTTTKVEEPKTDETTEK